MVSRACPLPPPGTGKAGLELWNGVCSEWDLGPHELAVLRQATRLADVCNRLAELLADDDVVMTGARGGLKLHPAAAELRMASLALGRLLIALRIGDSGKQEAGLRGVYGMPENYVQAQARRSSA